MFATTAKTGPPVAIQNLFVLVAAPNIWTNSKVKNILVLRGILYFREDYSQSAFPKEIISKTRVIP